MKNEKNWRGDADGVALERAFGVKEMDFNIGVINPLTCLYNFLQWPFQKNLQ